VFVLNVLAFVFIGLQIRPILIDLDPAMRVHYFVVAGAVLLTVIAVRIAWVMTYVTVVLWKIRRFGFHPRRPRPRPSFRGALIVSWSGMRGIVSLAAALALPLQINGNPFPYRELIVLTSSFVVLGTLIVQGLTLGPLLGVLDLQDDKVVEREVEAARARALAAALATFDGEGSEDAHAARHEFMSHMRNAAGDHDRLHQRAVAAARQVVLDMRAADEIGDAAFHELEEELDWIEMGNNR
jgi:CPA1 family monovalent cation:H+ antiporter